MNDMTAGKGKEQFLCSSEYTIKTRVKTYQVYNSCTCRNVAQLKKKGLDLKLKNSNFSDASI